MIANETEVRSLGGNPTIRYVRQGAKLKRYVSLHRGGGSKLIEIIVTYFLNGPTLIWSHNLKKVRTNYRIRML